MAVEFTFDLSNDEFNKLMELKDKNGKHGLTGNEYAKELLSGVINSLYRELNDNNKH